MPKIQADKRVVVLDLHTLPKTLAMALVALDSLITAIKLPKRPHTKSIHTDSGSVKTSKNLEVASSTKLAPVL